MTGEQTLTSRADGLKTSFEKQAVNLNELVERHKRDSAVNLYTCITGFDTIKRNMRAVQKKALEKISNLLHEKQDIEILTELQEQIIVKFSEFDNVLNIRSEGFFSLINPRDYARLNVAIKTARQSLMAWISMIKMLENLAR